MSKLSTTPGERIVLTGFVISGFMKNEVIVGLNEDEAKDRVFNHVRLYWKYEMDGQKMPQDRDEAIQQYFLHSADNLLPETFFVILDNTVLQQIADTLEYRE